MWEERIVHDKIVRDNYDVVIVGGGPAGLVAGLVLARARHSVLVIDPGETGTAPAGLDHREHVTVSRDQVREHGGEVVTAKVLSMPDARTVLADGHEVSARRRLTVTAPAVELPDVPGLAERWGRDVLHCPHCHGWEIRDQAVGVLSTDATAVDEALRFRQWTADVTLFLHTGPEPTNVQWRQLAARDIGVVDGDVVGLELEQDRLVGVQLRSGPVLAREALVVRPQFHPRPVGTDAVDTPVAAIEAALALSAELIAEDVDRAVAGHRAHEPFSAAAERHVHDRVIGHRPHGVRS